VEGNAAARYFRHFREMLSLEARAYCLCHALGIEVLLGITRCFSSRSDLAVRYVERLVWLVLDFSSMPIPLSS
jgi:hypothetical protein